MSRRITFKIKSTDTPLLLRRLVTLSGTGDKKRSAYLVSLLNLMWLHTRGVNPDWCASLVCWCAYLVCLSFVLIWCAGTTMVCWCAYLGKHHPTVWVQALSTSAVVGTQWFESISDLLRISLTNLKLTHLNSSPLPQIAKTIDIFPTQMVKQINKTYKLLISAATKSAPL